VARSTLNDIHDNTAGALTATARDSQKEKDLISWVSSIDCTVQLIERHSESAHPPKVAGVAHKNWRRENVVGVPNVPGEND
jgi:hypothetical protein